jgi:HAD superfamily hydrolase (TIGR01484 family)
MLLALDIDGTLLNWDGSLLDSSRQAVLRSLAADFIELVIATGRSALSAVGVAKRLGIGHGWAVCSNGSVIVRLDPNSHDGWEVAEVTTFDASAAIATIRSHLPNARIAIEQLGRGFLVTAPFPAGELDGIVQVVGEAELAALPATRLILRETELTAEQLTDIMEATQLPGTSYPIGGAGWVDLNPPGVSKASALEALRRQLGIDLRQTVAVGDGGNDITMLRWAARGVAMGGSRAEVIAAADEVTARLEDHGLAQVIDSLF